MKKILTSLAIAVALNFSISHAAQNSGFNVERLSLQGRAAYRKLFSADIFRIGGVGYSGETSGEELALYQLLGDADAVETLNNLVSNGSYEGGLYGLLGLRVTNIEEFNRAVEVYKSRKQPSEKHASRSIPGLGILKGEVAVQSGCILGTSNWLAIVSNIQSGRYDWILQK